MAEGETSQSVSLLSQGANETISNLSKFFAQDQLPRFNNQTTTTTTPSDNDNTLSLANDPMLNKLIASLVLFLVTLICGYAPVRFIVNQKYIQHAMFFGGGVLMATAFLHLIPEAQDNLRRWMPDDESATGATGHSHNHSATPAGSDDDVLPQRIPYAEMTICAGFIFMYLAELFMMRFINNHTHGHPCDSRPPMGDEFIIGERNLTSTTSGLEQQRPASQATSVGNLSCQAMIVPVSEHNRDRIDGTSSDGGGGGGGGACGGHFDGQAASTRATEFYKFLRGLLIISAFAVHSVFDGVAIGSQLTTVGVWTVFFAISCHKLIIAAVVGLELYAATLQSHLWTIIHLAIFSIMSPIGIILIVIAQNSLQLDDHSPSMALAQAFAAGTLLYIIFIEILQPKNHDNDDNNQNDISNNKNESKQQQPIGQAFSMILGFLLMLVVLTTLE